MNPEPIDISPPTKPLPSQSNNFLSSSLPSEDVDFDTIIRRWQPMGYRVTINLPFVSDDITPLFAIKNGPYIPPNEHSVQGAFTYNTRYHPIYPLPAETSAGTSVTVTRYDSAPSLAIASWAYRFWKGSMKYRLRNVANFISQGYIVTSVARQLYPIELHNNPPIVPSLATSHRFIPGLISGYRAYQQNSYSMADLSMYRHIECEVPYEYPLPYYDTYRSLNELTARMRTWVDTDNNDIEPNMGDNFVVVYARGALNSPTSGAQVTFELEYCPGDDFMFSSELAFSRHGLEVGNYNRSNHMTDSVINTTQGLPFTYPSS